MIDNVMSKKMETKNRVILSLVIFLSLAAFGELPPQTGDPLIDLAGQNILQTPTPPPTSGDKTADDLSAGVVGNPNNVKDMTVTDVNQGREQKLADLATTNDTGKGMAIATGVTLVSMAIPMLLSPIPSVVATGAALMANAGLEFGQAGVDAGASKVSKNQEKTLRANAGQEGQSAGDGLAAGKKEAAVEAANALSQNPELAKLLGERGINSDDFSKRLASGELSSPEAILAATGSTGVDSAALAQGVAAAKAEPLGHQDTLRAIQEDKEKAQDKPTPESSSSDPTFAGNGQKPSPDGKTGGAVGAHSDGVKGLINGLAGSIGEGGATALAAIRSASDGDLVSMLAGFMGVGQATVSKSADDGLQKLLTKEALAKKGISISSGNGNIFQLAHRNFRSFQKWRKKLEIAAR